MSPSLTSTRSLKKAHQATLIFPRDCARLDFSLIRRVAQPVLSPQSGVAAMLHKAEAQIAGMPQTQSGLSYC